MALTLVATPAAPDANAYCTQAQADALASYRVGAAAWLDLSPDEQIQALVTATSAIDTLEPQWWCSARTTTTQALAWPRDGEMTLPDTLVRATFELAFSYVPAFTAGSDTDVLNPDLRAGNIKRKKIDVLETEWFAPSGDASGASAAMSVQRFPPAVQGFLAPLMCSGNGADSNAWGIGLVERHS
jgi:hypothetical protein